MNYYWYLLHGPFGSQLRNYTTVYVSSVSCYAALKNVTRLIWKLLLRADYVTNLVIAGIFSFDHNIDILVTNIICLRQSNPYLVVQHLLFDKMHARCMRSF